MLSGGRGVSDAPELECPGRFSIDPGSADRILKCDPRGCVSCRIGDRPGAIRNLGYGPLNSELSIVGINPSHVAHDGIMGSFLIPHFAFFARADLEVPARYLRGAARAAWFLAIEAGIDLGRVYSTNVVKCATPGNRAPSSLEVETCLSRYLVRELEMLPNLRRVIALGRTAGAAFGLGDFGTQTRVEGTLAEVTMLRHPIATLRHWTSLKAEAAKWREAARGTSALARS